MPKIAFMGAGSTIFAKNILGDCMLADPLRDSHVALYDIDPERLGESQRMLENLNSHINAGRATFSAHLGVENRKRALEDADYVVNAIQVGGYKPSTVIDFEVPKKYGLGQTIADTLGIGGIFRALRTIPVVLDFCRDMEEVCPRAWFLNYTNPMAMITTAILRGSAIRAVGLCHSVPGLAGGLLESLGMRDKVQHLTWQVAGINHQAWLLEIKDGDRDLYPEIKQRAAAVAQRSVRLDMMLRLGYYMTEGDLHAAEYVPWFIKSGRTDLLETYQIVLDEYLRRCEVQIKGWNEQRDEVVRNRQIVHTHSGEYGARIMEAIGNDGPIRIHGNVMNHDLITNLPRNACVEVPCLVDQTGISPCHVGDLPEGCAAVNRTNINVQILAVEAALTARKDLVYQAAMLDPHTGGELSIDEIVNLCDDMFEAHGDMIPEMS
ncbi:MAG: alpha-glucosidase/alpha-galactosidase [Candidatus Latescibacterota bacterium]